MTLSPEQGAAFWLDSRIKFIPGGEGSGKSFLGALYGTARSLSDAYDGGLNEDLLYWVVGDDFEDARMEFDYVVEFMDKLGLVDRRLCSFPTGTSQTSVLRIPQLRMTWETVSAYDVSKIGRKQPRGVLGAEVTRYETVEVWNRIYGRLGRLNGWGWLSGSYEVDKSSSGWFAELVELGEGPNDIDVKSIGLPTWGNLFLFPGGYEDPKIQQLRLQSTESRFMERFGGKAATPSDSVLPEFKTILHVTERAEYDEDYPTYLFVDPGTKVYCVQFVQFVDDEVHIVDELYASRISHIDIVNACQLKPAWAGVGSRGHIIDIAGNAEVMGLGSAVEAWKELTNLDLGFAKQRELDQLDKLRSVLAYNPVTGRPRLQIHPRCKGIISEGGGGINPVEGQGRWRNVNGAPQKHDNNHAWKALSYGLLFHFGVKQPAGLSRNEDGGMRVYNYMNKASGGRQPEAVHDHTDCPPGICRNTRVASYLRHARV